MPLNETERELLKREAEFAYTQLERAQRRLTNADEEYREAQRVHVAAVKKWQALSRHYDPENA